MCVTQSITHEGSIFCFYLLNLLVSWQSQSIYQSDGCNNDSRLIDRWTLVTIFNLLALILSEIGCVQDFTGNGVSERRRLIRLTDKLFVRWIQDDQSLGSFNLGNWSSISSFFYLLFVADSDIGRLVNCVSVNRFDKTWSQRTHDWGVEKRVNPRRLFVVVVVLTIGTFWMRGTRKRGGTARQSYYGCWSIEASIEVTGNRLRVERGRTQLTVGVASALCVTIDVINYRWSAGFHRNWWIWMNFGTGGWSSMFSVKHRFSSMISFTDDVALFIGVFTWFHRWFFPFGTRWEDASISAFSLCYFLVMNSDIFQAVKNNQNIGE